MISSSNNSDINKNDGFIEIVFGSNWKYATSIRTFIQHFISINLNSSIKADKIALASSELIENAIKYSSKDELPIKFSLQFSKKDPSKKLKILVSNHSSLENIEILREEFIKIRYNTPYEAYLAKVKEIAIREDDKTMLGLARIRYETECDLNLKFENSIVTTEVNFLI